MCTFANTNDKIYQNMKKTLLITIMAVIFTAGVSAQSAWTLNSRAWVTNYWTSLIYDAARTTLSVLTTDNDDDDKQTLERIIPSANLVFPVGIERTGFAEPNDIRGPYYYAFGSPFKHYGDFAVGLDASWTPSVFGLYAGAYFKSQEIVFAAADDNLRGFYVQPRAGIVIGRSKATFEGGVFYDRTVACGGSYEGADMGMLSDGWGMDLALSLSFTGKSRSLIQFSMPFHNFLNEEYNEGMFNGMKRRVGYIFLTHRISL